MQAVETGRGRGRPGTMADDPGAPAGRSDRGRNAEHPAEVPARGWRDVLRRTSREMKQDNVALVAAGVAFFWLLTLVPALGAAISLYGLVGDPSNVEQRVGDLMRAAPSEARRLVGQQAQSVLEQSGGKVGFGLAVGVLLALWSASSGMKHLVDAVNLAYDEEDGRGFVRVRGLALLLTLGGLVFVGVAGSLVALLPNVGDEGSALRLALSILRWPLLGLLMVVAMAALYRFAPDRDEPRWSWVSPGALAATVAWVIGSLLFSLYTANFGTYNETYGSLGAVVVTMLWLFLTAFVLVAGAELNCELERQTAADSTEGRERPLGSRRAYAADTVATD